MCEFTKAELDRLRSSRCYHLDDSFPAEDELFMKIESMISNHCEDKPPKKQINTWLNEKLASIAKRLPKLVQHEPSSFACGHAMGYKQALLDLDNLLQESCDNEHQ